MLEKLQFPEGGGITINHPLWSRLDINQIYEMLDYDNRVLGIEIWNETCEILTKQGFSLEIWDQILSSGRRCYGFSVPDHHDSRQDWKGRNYLLVPEFNERECLKAYQEGKFYCAILGNGLKFDDISFSKGILTVEINKPSLIKIITNKNKIEKFEKVLKYKISLEKKEFVPNYIRIEAEDKTGERIFSQPIILRK